MIRALLLLATGCGPASQAPSAPHPQAALDTMDGRHPVPLHPVMALHQKQNMRDHLLVIQQIVDGVARQDWTSVESAAVRLGSSPRMEAQCTHMGSGAPGFTERALDLHRRADGIVAAARHQDSAAVLQATADTLSACTDCHAAYRQQLVSEAEWDALFAIGR